MPIKLMIKCYQIARYYYKKENHTNYFVFLRRKDYEKKAFTISFIGIYKFFINAMLVCPSPI